MRASIVYADDLAVKLIDLFKGTHKDWASVSIEMPLSHRGYFTQYGLEIESLQYPLDGRVYSQENWTNGKGKSVEKLRLLENPKVRYLECIHKCVQTYKDFVEVGIPFEQAKVLLPPQTVVEVTLGGELAKWSKFCSSGDNALTGDVFIETISSKVNALLFN